MDKRCKIDSFSYNNQIYTRSFFRESYISLATVPSGEEISGWRLYIKASSTLFELCKGRFNAPLLQTYLQDERNRYVNVNVKHEGMTPLYIACKNNNFQNVHVLLHYRNHEIKLDEQCEEKTPMSVACQEGYDNIIWLLLNMGAKVTNEDYESYKNRKWNVNFSLRDELEKKKQ